MNPNPSLPLTELLKLRDLLQHRLAVIGEKKYREEDPVGHLEALKKASEGITEWHHSHRAAVPPRLNHYLTQASFQKALEWLEQSV